MPETRHAVDELFRFALRQWCLALGTTELSRLLGVVPSKLNRAAGGATPSFELACRFQRQTGLPWIEVFTFPSKGSRSSVVHPTVLDQLQAATPLSRHSRDFDALEERLQAVLRRVAFHQGWSEAASALNLPRSTLHDGLQSRRLPWSLIWKFHEWTGTPVSELITGKEEAEEREWRHRVGSEDDYTGRMSDSDEPWVRLAELTIYNEIPCSVTRLEKLFRGRSSLAQSARLSVILAAAYKYRGLAARSRAALRKGWRRLRSRKTYFGPLIFHAAMAAHLGQHELAEEIGTRILRLTRSSSVLSQVWRLRADSALDRLRVDEAASMARRALALEAGPSLTRDQLEQTLAACAWMYGDVEEARWRARRQIRSATTPPILKRHAAELDLCMSIASGDAPVAGAALRQFRQFGSRAGDPATHRRQAEVYEWRIQLLRRKGGPVRAYKEDPWAETACLYAVCVFRATGDKTALKRTLARMMKEGWMDARHPIGNLRDFLSALRDSGLWSGACRSWLEEASNHGFHFI